MANVEQAKQRVTASSFQADLKALGLPADKVTIRQAGQSKMSVGGQVPQKDCPDCTTVSKDGHKFVSSHSAPK